ncbi:hypothetical protein ACBY01_16975, partial [Sphingomonas sp. ac-8]|uniref:hypothetical protein n=1 Tax=Sphingomonas sp. ac-8 TaxID=3242977 RepID=UPI003A7FEFB0
IARLREAGQSHTVPHTRAVGTWFPSQHLNLVLHFFCELGASIRAPLATPAVAAMDPDFRQDDE